MAKTFCLSFLIFYAILHSAIWISATPVDQIDVCSQPIENGICFGYNPRFGYDSEQKKCVQFTYGGCSGNKNNFEVLEDCQAACEACSQPIESGPCFGNFPRFGFNFTQKACVQFIYGGCAENKNNFNTAEDCQSTCEETKPSPVQEETRTSA